MAWDIQKQSGFGKGMNLFDDKRGLPDGQAVVIENFLMDENGNLYMPKADSAYNAVRVGGEVLGLWRHYGPTTADHRLVAVSAGSVRTADLNGVFQTGILNWQSNPRAVRFLNERYYSYVMDGQSDIRALGPIADGWVDPMPAAPTNTATLRVVSGHGDGKVLGTFQYKITNASAVGESNAGPRSTSGANKPWIWSNNQRIIIEDMVAKSGNNYNYVYRAEASDTNYPGDFKLVSKTKAVTLTDNQLAGDEDPGTIYADNLFEDAAKFGVEWMDRVFWAKANTIYISDPLIPTAVKTIVDVGGDGEITGLAPLSNMLIIFKPRCIWALSGNGIESYRVDSFTEQHGCDAPRSIVEFENYVWWVGNDNVWQMGNDGAIDRIGDQIRTILQDFPRDRLDAYAVGGYHDGKYYLSLADGSSNTTYVYHIGLKGWTRLSGAYSAFARLSAPGDTTFSGKFSPFMGADATGSVWQVQDAATRRTSARVRSREHDGGNPLAEKLYRSLRLAATPGGSCTVDVFATSATRTQRLSFAVADPSKVAFPKTYQGEATEFDMLFTNDGGEFVFRAYAVESQERPLR